MFGRALLIDLDIGGRSVTNDAYRVIRELHRAYGIRGRRVFYRCTMERIDEMLIRYGEFDGFAPVCPELQKNLKLKIATVL